MMKFHAAQRPVNDGLYYTHANKSRRKLTITIVLICFACLSTTAKCDDDRIIRVDPLALLSDTLRTYTKSGCDLEPITLSCPRGTSISIEIAQYMPTSIENECVSSTVTTIAGNIQDGVVNAGTEIEIKAPEKCSWTGVLNYSLLQTVVEACQKKRHCKFISSPKTLQGDPCPAVRKFVEISYKCRPYEFRSKVACENDVIQLMCNPYSRIAVYGATYGRAEYESLQCAQPSGTSSVHENVEPCSSAHTTSTVMKICHGQRKCILTADSTTFGNPCKPDTRMYLKVVYTCVPKRVLRDSFDTPAEPDEPQQNDIVQDHDELYDDDQFYKEPEAIPPEPKLSGDSAKERGTDLTPEISFPNVPSSVRPPLRNRDDSTLEEHHERYYLYLIISVTIGVVLCLIIITGRIIISKSHEEVEDSSKDEPKFHKSNTGETTITKGFSGDNICDMEGGDIDLSTPMSMGSMSAKNEKSSFNTYAPSLQPYVSIVPTSSSALLIRPPTSIQQQQQASSILMGSSGLNNNPSILAQSPSNLANLQFRTLPRQQHIGVNRNLSDCGTLVSVIPSPSATYMTGSVLGHHTIRRATQSGLVESMPMSIAIPTSMSATATFYPRPPLSVSTSQHQQPYFYG